MNFEILLDMDCNTKTYRAELISNYQNTIDIWERYESMTPFALCHLGYSNAYQVKILSLNKTRSNLRTTINYVFNKSEVNISYMK